MHELSLSIIARCYVVGGRVSVYAFLGSVFLRLLNRSFCSVIGESKNLARIMNTHANLIPLMFGKTVRAVSTKYGCTSYYNTSSSGAEEGKGFN